jgi:SAM-dependent methyltransferase
MSRLRRIKNCCEDKRVLDIGCYGDRTSYGHPLWLHGHILDVANEAVGIDIYEDGIEELQEDGYDVHHGNAENFDIGDSFDIVVAAEVIEHLTNPSGFLKSVEKHLDSDGVLLITTPNLHSLFVLGAYLSPFYTEKEHSIGFTPTILRNLLERCGWTVESLELITHEDIPNTGNNIINALVPKRLNFTIFCVAHPNNNK